MMGVQKHSSATGKLENPERGRLLRVASCRGLNKCLLPVVFTRASSVTLMLSSLYASPQLQPAAPAAARRCRRPGCWAPCASLRRQDSTPAHLGGRQQRRGADLAVEPLAAVSTTAAADRAVGLELGSGRGRSSSSSSVPFPASSNGRLRVAVDVDEGEAGRVPSQMRTVAEFEHKPLRRPAKPRHSNAAGPAACCCTPLWCCAPCTPCHHLSAQPTGSSAPLQRAASPPRVPPPRSAPTTVLGRFLHSLNKFCLEEYGMQYDVSDYHCYDFAKAGCGGRHAVPRCPAILTPRRVPSADLGRWQPAALAPSPGSLLARRPGRLRPGVAAHR